MASLADDGTIHAKGQVVVTLCTIVVVGIVARFLGPLWTSGAVIVAVGVAVLLTPGSVVDSPFGAPLGYANANAALMVLTAAAAVLVARRSRPEWLRGLGWLVAVAAAVVPLVSGALAATGSAVLLGLAVVVSQIHHGGSGSRRIVVAGAALVAAACSATVAMALVCPCEGGIGRAVTDNRVALWADAIDLAAAHPLTGVGLGRFDQASPTAAADDDLPHAHGELLQTAAEAGLPGLALALVLIGAVYAHLARAARTDPDAIVVAAAITGLLVHAQVDYVLRFPAIWLVAAALLVVIPRPGILPGHEQPRGTRDAEDTAGTGGRVTTAGHGDDDADLPPRGRGDAGRA